MSSSSTAGGGGTHARTVLAPCWLARRRLPRAQAARLSPCYFVYGSGEARRRRAWLGIMAIAAARWPALLWLVAVRAQ